MSISVTSHLAWGFDLGEDSNLPKNVREKVNDFHNERWRELKPKGLELLTHGCDNNVMNIIAIARTMKIANLWASVEVPDLANGIDIIADQAILDWFSKEIGIEPRPGQWILAVSMF